MTASAIRRHVKVPVFHAGRVTDLSTAEFAIAEGHVDMIGMTRAHIADPHLIAKAQAGQEERIRPCVGARYCLDRIYVGKDALCIHNAATGRESSMPHVIPPAPIDARRRVTIVGAGPAGLEAARVCAERGHNVILFEAANEPGGQIRLAAKVSWRRDQIAIVDWLSSEVRRLGVVEHYNVYATADDVRATSPEIVIVATGGVPNTDIVAGSDHVVSVWDILSGQIRPAQRVLLFDDNGQHQGPSTAEFMSDAGSNVEIVTPDRMIGHDVGATNFAVYYEHLYQKGVKMTPDRRLRSVMRVGNQLHCTLVNEYTDAEEARLVDQVVVEHGTLPANEVFLSLKDGSVNGGELDHAALIEGRRQPTVGHGYSLFRVGDAVSSRNIHAAIYDSLRLCKDL